jgi:radical SAM superfamily enzyme YgiQ (UPF0313 family)
VFQEELASPETGRLLSQAGCRTIFFGFESAVPRILGLMRKMNRMETVLRILDNLTRSHISCHLNVIVGFPTETMEEAQETLDFLRKRRELYGNYSLQRFSLERGTQIFKSPAEYGISRILDVEDRTNVSTREGLLFDTAFGMNAAQRQYMALKGQVVYRKPTVPMRVHVARKLGLVRYFLRHRKELRSVAPRAGTSWVPIGAAPREPASADAAVGTVQRSAPASPVK